MKQRVARDLYVIAGSNGAGKTAFAREFLPDYACRIHALKPDHCRKYPTSRRHADETGCPGYWHAAPA